MSTSKGIKIIGAAFIFLGVFWGVMMGCPNIAVFTPRRASCRLNMKHMREMLSDSNPLDAWKKIRTDYIETGILNCSGFGAGESPYLLIPRAYEDPSLPLIAERPGNHIEEPIWKLGALECTGISAGINAISAAGEVKWLSPGEVHALAQQFVEKGVDVYDVQGKTCLLTDVDTTGRTRFLRLDFYQIYQVPIVIGVLLAVIGFAVGRSSAADAPKGGSE